MKKKLFVTAMAVVMALGTVGCSNTSTNTSTSSKTPSSEVNTGAAAGTSGGTIKVGVIVSATGVMAGGGEYMKNAMTLVANEINEAGGVLGKNIELVIEDDQSDQTTAINMMNKMGSNKDIVAVFGPHTSTNATAVSNTVQEYGIPYFTGGTSTRLKDLGNEYMFMTRANDQIVVNAAMEFVSKTLGAKKIGILYINDEFGIGGRDLMVKFAEENDMEYVEANHNATDQDLTSQIMQMKQANIDVMIAWSSNVCSLVARQTTELGFDKPVMMNAAFGGQSILDSLPVEATVGKYAAADFTAEDPAPEIAEFVKKYELEFGTKPVGDWAANYYGAMKMLVQAIENADSTDREAIKDAMYEIKDFKAPLGPLTTDKNGILVHQASIIKAVTQENGKNVFELIEKVKEAGY